ncbi:MAG: glycosyltransferase family 9 protein [Flavobacteriales bacterium]
MSEPLKILIIRLSSIGDIVLTSPVVRCLKKQSNAEIHFLTNNQHTKLLHPNPYIDHVHSYPNDLEKLDKLPFDWLIDLHHNLRTFRLKRRWKVANKSFEKLNIEKFLLTKFKYNCLPNIHIVDRYLKTVEHLGIVNDNKGLDFFIPKETKLPSKFVFDQFVAIVIGGTHATKVLPTNKLIELCNSIVGNFVLIGGPDDTQRGNMIINEVGRGVNACGTLSIFQSALLVKNAEKVITHDTGMMHIAAAYQKNIISVWGNTVPDFGMYPYMAGSESKQVEVENLPCRPCSKIGYDKCPKGHFKCMNLIDINQIS